MRKLLFIIVALLLMASPAHAVIFISGTSAPGACTWSTVWDAEVVTGDSTWTNYAYANRNNRTYILSGDTTGGGSKVRITFVAHSTNAGEITDAAIGPKKASADPYDFASAPTNITFSAADNGALPAGGTLVSDEITFAFETTQNYIVSVWSSDGDMAYLDDPGPIWLQVRRNLASDDTETVDTSGYTNHAYVEYLWKIEACN